jgi:hypothetical protein
VYPAGVIESTLLYCAYKQLMVLNQQAVQIQNEQAGSYQDRSLQFVLRLEEVAPLERYVVM